MALPPPSRPRFPVQLDTLVATKKIAARAGNSGAGGLKGLKNTAFSGGFGSVGSFAPIKPTAPLAPPEFHSVRLRMVQRLVAQGCTNARVLAAMGSVARHAFVDSALAFQAYEDTSLPIGWGQTISKPNVVARMLELLLCNSAQLEGRVLEIGTGCGYQAALLAHLYSHVTSLERIAGLYARAGENLRCLPGLPQGHQLHLLHADGMAGHMPSAPYTAIIAAAGGFSIPPAWTDQLAIGGRLVAPLAAAGRNLSLQTLVVIDKTSHGLHKTLLEPVHFVPLKSGLE